MTKTGFLGWRMVAIGFFAQNLAIGSLFGSFGVLIKPVAEEFGANRSTVALAMGLITLLMGITSPVVGRYLDRGSLRNTMLLGGVTLSAGLLLSAASPNVGVFLLLFGVVAGIGCTLLGSLPTTALITNWFTAKRGTAVGIANVPLMVAIVPLIVNQFVERYSWQGALVCLGACVALFLPFLFLVRSRPAEVGQQPLGQPEFSYTTNDPDSTSEAPRTYAPRDLLASRLYWTFVICAGMVICGSIVLVSHLFAFATDRGIPNTQAALLLSINGVSAMLGTMGFGWLADRLGGERAMALIAGIQAVFWGILISASGMSQLLLAIVVIGACGGGLYPAWSVLIAQQYGSASFGTAMGLATLLTIPFSFLAPPLAGYLFEQYGNYQLSFSIHIGLFSLAMVVFLAHSFVGTGTKNEG